MQLQVKEVISRWSPKLAKMMKQGMRKLELGIFLQTLFRTAFCPVGPVATLSHHTVPLEGEQSGSHITLLPGSPHPTPPRFTATRPISTDQTCLFWSFLISVMKLTPQADTPDPQRGIRQCLQRKITRILEKVQEEAGSRWPH